MDHWWKNADRITDVLGDKPAPLPLCPPRIPLGLAWNRTRVSATQHIVMCDFAQIFRMPENCRCCELEFRYLKVRSGSSEVTFFFFKGGLKLDCHEIVIRAHRHGEISIVSMLAAIPGFIVSYFSILLWAMKCLDVLLLSQEGSLSG